MRHVTLGALSLAVVALVCASPGLLGERVRASFDGLAGASPSWLWLAASCFALTKLSSAAAWRTAIRSCGTTLQIGDAAARYCTGSGVNAIAPAHIGSAVRLMLFGRKVEGGVLIVSGVSAAVGATRAVWMIGLIALGCASGVLPAWPLFALAGGVAASVAAAYVTRHVQLPDRIATVLAAFRELGGTPRDLALVAAWTLAGAVAKIAAAAAVAASLDVPHPVRAALIIVPVIELSAVLPVTPGNVGVGSAAIAFALSTQGVGSELGLTVGIAFGGIEWLIAVGSGIAGAFALAGPVVRPRFVFASAVTTCGLIAWAFGATVIAPSLA